MIGTVVQSAFSLGCSFVQGGFPAAILTNSVHSHRNDRWAYSRCLAGLPRYWCSGYNPFCGECFTFGY